MSSSPLPFFKENIIQELAKRIEREEDGKSNNQSSSDSLRRESEDNSEEEEDCVLAEIGISSSKEEEESTEEEEMIESTHGHGLGEEQLESKFKVALKRISISWTW